MCYNCGCHNPSDNMGSDTNITEATLQKLADHWGKSLDDTKQQLSDYLSRGDAELEADKYVLEMFTKAATSWGQSVEEAKKETLSLLKSKLKS